MWETQAKSLNLACYNFWKGALLDILLELFFWINDGVNFRQMGVPFVQIPCYNFWQRFRNPAQSGPKPLIANPARYIFGERSMLQFSYFETYGRIDFGRSSYWQCQRHGACYEFATMLSIPSGTAQQQRIRFCVRVINVIPAFITNRGAAFQLPSALATASLGGFGKGNN